MLWFCRVPGFPAAVAYLQSSMGRSCLQLPILAAIVLCYTCPAAYSIQDMYKGVQIAKHIPLSLLPHGVTANVADTHYRWATTEPAAALLLALFLSSSLSFILLKSHAAPQRRPRQTPSGRHMAAAVPLSVRLMLLCASLATDKPMHRVLFADPLPEDTHMLREGIEVAARGMDNICGMKASLPELSGSSAGSDLCKGNGDTITS